MAVADDAAVLDCILLVVAAAAAVGGAAADLAPDPVAVAAASV